MKGFSLVEILIVIGIITVLSLMAILYSHTGERQIALFQEQMRVLNVISRAKSLSVNTFNKPDVPCGFGVHFDKSDNSFRIFKEQAVQQNCSDVDFKYSGASEDFEGKFVLDPKKAIIFDTLAFDDIIFYPPEPTVIISPNFFQDEAIIGLKISGSSQPSVIIKVNKLGMITTQ